VKWFDRLHMVHRFWRYRLRSERQELAFLLQSPLRGEVVADIGANLGIYSYWMHKAVGPAGKVIAFEPQAELQTHLDDLRNTFALRNLTIVPKGLSNASRSANLLRPRTHWGGASLEHVTDEETESLPVELTTLDEYFAQRSARLRFIKCDVEGHEEKVFEGGRRLLSEDLPILLFECGEEIVQRGELFSNLADNGYQGRFFHDQSLHDIAELDVCRDQIEQPYLNYVFATAEDWQILPMCQSRSTAAAA
jgi:FkbM family methyltransferase